LKDKLETKVKNYRTTARLSSYWKAAGQLRKGRKCSGFNQRSPKATELTDW